MNKLEWKARIDDTDVAKQESKVDKKEKRKVQRKSRTKKKSERRAHPVQKKRQHQRECNALIRDFCNIALLIFQIIGPACGPWVIWRII